MSHYLGLLAAAAGQAEDAIRHFEEAIELEEQIGALPYLAHSLHGLAAALTARAGPGDAGRGGTGPRAGPARSPSASGSRTCSTAWPGPPASGR